MDDFDTPTAQVHAPTRHDVHATDVLMRFSERTGAQWYSVIETPNSAGMVLVQDQDGAQFWARVSSFDMRYSLKGTGHLNLRWRTSPIAAVAAHKH